MKRVALAGFSLACVWSLSPRDLAAAAPPPLPPAMAAAAPLCTGAYADDFAALTAQARDFDRHPEATFSYCTRSSAVYECLSYGPDATVHRERRKVVAHGTAFAYRRQGADTLLLTNDHVAAWPAVTDAQHVVEGVPAGCKRVSESLALVDDEHDDYARDDVPVTRVVTDPQLDVAVLKAHSDLHVMPWKIGHSSAIRERNAVEVRGFPLGAFRATSLGKVISEHDHDDYGDWDHDDFVIDALLSAGNSGSPVLAVSCTTGEYELVGIFHAGYTAGSALNVVIGIDQVRDLMTTLKRTPHEHVADVPALDGALRAHLDETLASEHEIFFPFGANVAVLRPGAERRAAVRDLQPRLSAGGRAAGADRGSARRRRRRARARAASARSAASGSGRRAGSSSTRTLPLDTDGDPPIARVLDALRTDAAAHVAYRGLQRQDSGRARRRSGSCARRRPCRGRRRRAPICCRRSPTPVSAWARTARSR